MLALYAANRPLLAAPATVTVTVLPITVVPPASVVTLDEYTAAPNVVTPVLLSVSAPSAVLPPTMPVKVIAPLPAVTVSACAPLTVLLKVTALFVVVRVVLAPRVTAPV